MLSYPSGVQVSTRVLTLLTDLLAATLAPAVQAAAEKAYVVLDGTVPPIDRVFTRSGRDGPYYSGKAHRHGIPQALAAAGVRTFVGGGYQGAGLASASRAAPGASPATPAGTCPCPATRKRDHRSRPATRPRRTRCPYSSLVFRSYAAAAAQARA
jgi:hypothetical protein